jgi:hypothetical protein
VEASDVAVNDDADRALATKIKGDIARYVDGVGPDKEAEHVALAGDRPVVVESTRAAWSDARAKRKGVWEQNGIKPAETATEQYASRLAKIKEAYAKTAAPEPEPEAKIGEPEAEPKSEPDEVEADREEAKPEAKEAEDEAAERTKAQDEVAEEAKAEAERARRKQRTLAVIKEFNEKHAVISNLGGKCVVMEWVPSKVFDGKEELEFQTFSAFKERYLNKYIDGTDEEGKPTRKQAAPFWLAHSLRRQYEGLDMVPGAPPVLPNRTYNLWRGWGVKPKPGCWKLLERHIVEVLANGDEAFAGFILKYTAWKFQNPGDPPQVVLALRGGEGTGKGVWGKALMRIWGKHGLQIHNAEYLTGTFNKHLQDKLFLYLDEAVWAGNKEAERLLKGLVTEDFMMIRAMRIDPFPWRNRLSIMMSSNDKWLVPASHDARRYAVNDVSCAHQKEKEYFAPLFAEVNGDGPAAMLYDMLRLDLKGWHPRDNVPQTKALTEQKMLSLGGMDQWYCNLLDRGELPSPQPKNPRMVLSHRLYQDAKAYTRKNSYLTETEFGRYLRYECGCQHKSTGAAWAWIFPPLPDARAAWVRKFGDWPWQEPDLVDWGVKPDFA